MLEEDLLVGESHPLVDLCSLLDVGGEDGLVGTELGDCLLSASNPGKRIHDKTMGV